MMNLDQVYLPIASEMTQVRACLEETISESSDLEIRQLCTYLQESSGKMLRPALVCLCAKIACQGDTEKYEKNIISLASAMELVHLASLIHDDIVDRTLVRRGRPSVNAHVGNEVSLLLGDFIFTKALRLVSRCGSHAVFVRISDAIHDMCEGELSQVCRRGCWDLSKEDYIDIVRKKTATLFAVSCGIGVMIGQGPDNLDRILTEFGMNLGTAYQISDDYRDISVEENALGKPPRQDLHTGDITLPLIHLREAAMKAEDGGRCAYQKNGIAHSELLQTLVADEATLSVGREAAQYYGQQAVTFLKCIPVSAFKTSLECMTGYIINGLV